MSGATTRRPCANGGHWLSRATPGAQFRLGYMYANGEGVPKGDAEAVKWFRKAAEQGDAWGQLGLGLMYHSGPRCSRRQC